MAKQIKSGKKKKTQQIIAGFICILLILCMVLPMFLGSF